MKRKVALFLFIDAMGWEVIQRFPNFLSDIAPARKPLETIFGYSSACDPSIISGKLPNQHTLWSSFYYSPETSPFASYRWLSILPGFIMNNHRVRSRLSRLVAQQLGYSGYVQLYNVPFAHLPYFDYAEKKRIYAPGGLPKEKSIFDLLVERNISYHMAAAGVDDVTKIKALVADLKKGDIELAYVTLGQLDALMHRVGPYHVQVGELLQWYEQQIQSIVATAENAYDEVALYIFADHGMHEVTGSYDLQRDIDKLGLKYGEDYAAMFDSTMARFWFLNDDARKKIQALLDELDVGAVVSDDELRSFGVYFEDHRYGETIFLMRSGWLIVPSYMGQRRIPGMHGYHPKDLDSYAAMLSNRALPTDVTIIHHIFQIMQQELGIEIPCGAVIP